MIKFENSATVDSRIDILVTMQEFTRNVFVVVSQNILEHVLSSDHATILQYVDSIWFTDL